MYLVPETNPVTVEPVQVWLLTAKQAAQFLQVSERTVHSRKRTDCPY